MKNSNKSHGNESNYIWNTEDSISNEISEEELISMEKEAFLSVLNN